jgi:hypothetical protein
VLLDVKTKNISKPYEIGAHPGIHPKDRMRHALFVITNAEIKPWVVLCFPFLKISKGFTGTRVLSHDLAEDVGNILTDDWIIGVHSFIGSTMRFGGKSFCFLN